MTRPPRASIAISEVPPPTSTTMLPTGSWIGRPAPIAAANGPSTRLTDLAPAEVSASSTARRSTGVSADGTAARTRGLGRRDAPTLRKMSRRNCSVSSKLAMALRRRGRTATNSEGRSPAACHASRPIAATAPVRTSTPTSVGSLKTTPRPCWNTSVLAVPRSTARSRRLMKRASSGRTRHQGPITHWASPVASRSFFQMGTLSLIRSIP